MEKAFALVQKFRFFAPKDAPQEKDDIFSLRLKRLQRLQAIQTGGQLFRTSPTHREA